MAIQIGIDEAGLGPNLGPYTVTVSIWEVPDRTPKIDLWKALANVVTNEPCDGDQRLHLADSKVLFQPGRGLMALERGVLTAVALCLDSIPATDRRLRQRLTGDPSHGMDGPWYADDDLPLPCDWIDEEILPIVEQVRAGLQMARIRLLGLRTAIVEPAGFNDSIDVHQNKAEALSRVSLSLLRYAVDSTAGCPVVAWCDKHGGRNRYEQLLRDCFDGEMVFCRRESAELSVYRIGNLEVRFLPRAESFLPVALASMVSKYVRELAMRRFNRFWLSRIPGLKPTQGYPGDAQRFREEISSEVLRLEIPERSYWRCR